ncbi:MAG TPA: family 43 glycosylhydrolase [Pyrinomonadaceae bacterium]|jgi:beta-xylosidase
MRRSIYLSYITALLCLCLSVNIAAQTGATYTNPVIAGDFPDPSVVRVGEDYWATATTGGWMPHFAILHSRDLVNWRPVGAVFQTSPAWAKGDFWAPEISVDGGRFYVYYTARRNDGAGKKGTLCVAVATSDAPSGPYTDHGPLVCQDIGSIDAFTFRDETNQRYLIWKEDGNDRSQPTPIWAQTLSEDGIKLTGKPKQILRNTAAWERHVVEGSFIVRRNGWYYHFYSGNACCGRGCRYALGVARSRTLLGKWEKNPANPILAANAAWQCPGHGSIVTTPDGRDFLLYHSYRQRRDTFNIGREALLDEIHWDAATGWPTINEGRGASTTAASPFKVVEQPDETTFYDGFSKPELSAVWQWPMMHRQSARIDVLSEGHLLLAPLASAPPDEWTGAVLARRTTSGDYTATTLVDMKGMTTGVRAGLAAYSWRDAAVGVAVGSGKVSVWRREGRSQQRLATANAPAAQSVYLRMIATDGERYRFAFSDNGRDWTELGEPVDGSYIEGARVALTTGGGSGAVGRFDWIRIAPAHPEKAGTSHRDTEAPRDAESRRQIGSTRVFLPPATAFFPLYLRVSVVNSGFELMSGRRTV